MAVNFHMLKIIPTLLALVVLLWSCQSEPSPEKTTIPIEEGGVTSNSKYLMQKTFQFELGNDSVAIDLSLDTNLRQQYLQAPHQYSYQGSKLPANWREEYYQMFVSHPKDQSVVGELLGHLKALKPGLSQDELVESATAFVQGSVTYDWNTYHNIDNSQIRYPYETLVDGTGVCADKTILLARLLNELGYGLAIFTFERANHMALGIKVPQGYDNFRSGYAFIESTNYAPIGRIPNNYVGGLKLDRRPSVIRINSSQQEFKKIAENRVLEKELEKQYGKDYFFLTAEQKSIKAEMVTLQSELDSLKKEMRGCQGTLPQDKYEKCNKLQQQHNTRVASYNALVEKFNALNTKGQTPS